MGEKDATLKLGWRGETRDYSTITPSIGEVRDDDRNRYQAELKIPLGEHFFIQFEYEYSDYSSNLESADYSQNLAALQLGVTL